MSYKYIVYLLYIYTYARICINKLHHEYVIVSPVQLSTYIETFCHSNPLGIHPSELSSCSACHTIRVKRAALPADLLKMHNQFHIRTIRAQRGAPPRTCSKYVVNVIYLCGYILFEKRNIRAQRGAPAGDAQNE